MCFEDKFPLFTSHFALRLECLFASMWACFSARTDPSPVVFAFLLLIYWLLWSERCHFLSVTPHSFAAHRDHLQLFQTLPFPFSLSFSASLPPLFFHLSSPPRYFISSCDSLSLFSPHNSPLFSPYLLFPPSAPSRSPSERLRIPKGADAIKMLILSVYRER